MTRAAQLRGYLLAAGLAISCLASAGALAAQDQPWQRHNAAGLAALEARRFLEAGQRFAVALREAQRPGPKNGSETGAESAAVATTLDNQARLMMARGDFDGAETRLRRVLAIRQRAYGPRHWAAGQTLYNIGVLYHFQGDLARAEPFYRRALVVQQRTLGPEHPELADTLDNYADILSVTGRDAEAALLKARAARIRSAGSSEGAGSEGAGSEGAG